MYLVEEWAYVQGSETRPTPFWVERAAAIGIGRFVKQPSFYELFAGDPAAVPVLLELLAHGTPRVRRAGAFGLYLVGSKSPEAVAALSSLIVDGDGDTTLIRFARYALRKIDPELEFTLPLCDAARDGADNAWNQRDLTDAEKHECLGGDPAAVPRLRAFLDDPSPNVRQAALYGLYRVGKKDPDAVAALVSVAVGVRSDRTMVGSARRLVWKVDPDTAASKGVPADGP